MKLYAHLALGGLTVFLATACGGDVDDPHDHNEQEVITKVTLTFTPSGGGSAIEASFNDADGPGGAAPTVDDITLSAGTTYTVRITFTNGLEDPAEDITAEVEEESDEHQVFFTGSAVEGPASTNTGAPLLHAYTDQDANGNPVGLENTIEARSAGAGTMTVTLRHLPPLADDQPQKTAGLAAAAAAQGISGLPGDTDASVDFAVTVQ
jgi:hypothetical protein